MSKLFNILRKRNNEVNNEISISSLQSLPLPVHIAIIMDGNGRWAQARKLPRAAGHRAGMETLKRIVEASGDVGIKHLTVYAFSTENWKRPKEEVDTLMNLLVEYIQKELDYLHSKGIRVNTIGQIEELPEHAVTEIKKATEKTSQNQKLNLNIALNYGSRNEMLTAIKKTAEKVAQGEIDIKDIDEEVISQNLYTKGTPDPDLVIRTSGEMRMSNFLLWQVAYAEFWSTKTMWPDFSKNDLYQAISDYQKRHRRFGGL